ncbi:MAG: HD domain-containing protein [Halanaerobiales bacterium]|nr:HD domain-containing protein [Halanaerobiales bacterium]
MELKKNKLIADAIEIAVKAHHGGTRKGGDNLPYIIHPIEVALTLQKNEMSDAIIAAGLLHDTLEDTYITVDDLMDEFGEKITNLVIGASEELENRENTSWEQRKEYTVKHLKNVDLDIKYIACADKLSNIRSMIRDHDKIGDDLWERFNRGYDKQKWYYENLVISLKELEDLNMYEQFKEAVYYLFGKTEIGINNKD